MAARFTLERERGDRGCDFSRGDIDPQACAMDVKLAARRSVESSGAPYADFTWEVSPLLISHGLIVM